MTKTIGLKTTLFLPLILAAVLPSLAMSKEPGQQNSWESKARHVLQLANEMDNRTITSARYEKEDREGLTKALKRLQEDATATEKKLAETRHELMDVSARRVELADRYQQEMADMKTVEGIFSTALQQSIARFTASPVAAQYPEQLAHLEAMAKGTFFLEIKDLQQYSNILLTDMAATRAVETRKSLVIDLDGYSASQQLYRAGGFFLGYQDGDQGIFALPQGAVPSKSILSQGPAQKYMKSWIAGKSEILPIDVTGGTAFKAIQQERGLKEWMEDGGPLLYPILLAGLVGVLVVLLKTIHLFSLKRLPEKVRKKVFSALQEGKEAEPLLAEMRFYPAARVMLSSLSFKDRGLDAIDSGTEESIMREESRLDRFLSTVGVLASISPLLGLLGTVTGMIDTFQAITVYGTGDPRMMSTGISEALITTQAGLGIALPLLLAHHFLKRRVGALVADMEEAGSGITAELSAR